MTDILKPFLGLKEHIKYKPSEDKPTIDNLVFRLHYRVTCLILAAATVLVFTQAFIGEHIRCIVDKGLNGVVPAKVINTFCFFSSTFSVVKYLKNPVPIDAVGTLKPGIGPYKPGVDEIVVHNYYQWIPYLLFLQFISFYATHRMWKSAEGGVMKGVASGLKFAVFAIGSDEIKLDDKRTIPKKEKCDEKIRVIRESFINRIHINRHWAYKLWLFEILNIFFVFFNFYITDVYLNGNFHGLVPEISNNCENCVSPLDIVFPKMAKCTFHKYGASGTIEIIDALCVLSANVINEKIYVFLWYWFIVLFILSILAVVWRIATVILYSRSRKFNELVFQMNCAGKFNPWDIFKAYDYNYCDWLFLYYISKNVDNYVFNELTKQIAETSEKIHMESVQTINPAFELGDDDPDATFKFKYY